MAFLVVPASLPVSLAHPLLMAAVAGEEQVEVAHNLVEVVLVEMAALLLHQL
jgi:hypothetical protein